MTLFFLLGAIAAGLSLSMAAAWAIIIRTGKSGWADTFWTASIGVGGCVAALAPVGGEPVMARMLIAAALVAWWSLRLATHIGRRTLSGGDDPRYAQLRQEWGARYRPRLFLFLQIQAAAAFVLVLTVLIAANNPTPLGPGDVAGIIIAICAVMGEGISDAQLAAFKADSANKGEVCDTGLWSLSRHPNYFFEWLFWLGYVPIAASLAGYPWGWASLMAPVLMYGLLVHVSGVPPLETHMLRSRGPGFAAYQRRVRAFWPIPKASR